MRRFLPFLLFAACADSGPYSPSEPEQFDSRMFNRWQLMDYEPADRAYVMGHAIGVYLYGKTLPTEVEGTGFAYPPGFSSPNARVPYRFVSIMEASSGGTDGTGVGVLYDDVEPPPTTDPEEPGPCDGSDDVGDGCDPVDPDDTGEPTDPWIDGDCETFLDPAAVRARELAERVNAQRILAGDGELLAYVEDFERGLRDALRVEDFGEDPRWSEIEHTKDHVQAYGLCDHSPIILDLFGDGVTVSAPEDGVRFDMFEADGQVLTAWPSGDDALLGLDRDGDGRIRSAAELFGNSRVTAAGGALDPRARYADGFEMLAELDRIAAGGNEDGVIDERDARFASLVLWRDADRDGVSDDGELVPLAAERIVSLSLDRGPAAGRDANGNRHGVTGAFVRTDAAGVLREGSMVDVWFRIRNR